MIPFFKSNLRLTDSDSKEIKNIINSGIFCNGKYIEKLENHFKEKFNIKYAVACSNCTSGLIIAVKVLGIEKQSVLLPAFTWPSTLYAVQCNNNVPLWCDINLESWDVSPNLSNGYFWESQISVDVFGNESYISPKSQFSDKIPTIYDAAHGYGLDNLGHRGDIEVVSLGINKGITCTQGGMILFNEELYNPIRNLVNLSAKMTEVNAFIGLKSIKDYDKNKEIKKNIIQLYRDNIKIPYKEQVTNSNSVYSVYSIIFNTIKKRNAVAEKFIKNNIEVKSYYKPLVFGLKNTDYIYNRILSLPVYQGIEKEIEKICKLINET